MERATNHLCLDAPTIGWYDGRFFGLATLSIGDIVIKRKLELRKQTLRELGRADLSQVKGGENTITDPTCDGMGTLCNETHFTCDPKDCTGNTILPTGPECTDYEPCVWANTSVTFNTCPGRC